MPSRAKLFHQEIVRPLATDLVATLEVIGLHLLGATENGIDLVPGDLDTWPDRLNRENQQ